MQAEIRQPGIFSRYTDVKTQAPYRGQWMNKPIALVALVVMSPILLCAYLAQLVFQVSHKNQIATANHSQHGAAQSKPASQVLVATQSMAKVLAGKISLCGLSNNNQLSKRQIRQLKADYKVKDALIDAASLHHSTGLVEKDDLSLIKAQLNGSQLDYVKLCIKGLFCFLFYQDKQQLARPGTLTLFGLKINNDNMQQAVKWVTQAKEKCAVAVFINAHSVNLAAKSASLKLAINRSDKAFADGSGMRVAAQSAGYHLKDNVNGTDMLPLLCAQAASEGKRIFLLGAKPGVAEKAASNLVKAHPGLNISGCADGYFADTDNCKMIERINQAETDILLVALGSPRQEQWLVKNASTLNCSTALAVGGLFDFFSGDIARAPIWMRELGLEWVWRLLQEPKTKFHRYVIGTPLFLFRTFVLKQHIKGE